MPVSNIPCGLDPGEVFQRVILAARVADFPEDHGGVLARGDGLLEPPHFAQSRAKVNQGAALAVPVAGLPADHADIPVGGDGFPNRRTSCSALPRLVSDAAS